MTTIPEDNTLQIAPARVAVTVAILIELSSTRKFDDPAPLPPAEMPQLPPKLGSTSSRRMFRAR